MTTTEQPVRRPEPERTHAVPGPRRRGLLSRLSVGHVVMLLAALLAGLTNYAVLRARDDTVTVAVAARDLRAGETVSAGDFTFTDLRADTELLGTLLEPDRIRSVQGWVVTTATGAGELVRGSDLQAPSAPSERRAMSIPIEPEHAVAGDLQPGDRVDVIEVEGRTATYLVTDAEVLAVPAQSSGGIAGGLRTFSVSIAVDDETALRLAVAIRSGQLELVRSTGSARATIERFEQMPPPGQPPSTGDGAVAADLQPHSALGSAAKGGEGQR